MRKNIFFYSTLIVLMTLALVVFPRTALAQRETSGREEDITPAEIYEKLQLTEDQKVKLEENREKYHIQLKKLKAEIAQLQKQLNWELKQKNLDRIKIDEMKYQLDRLQAQLSEYRLQGIMEVREILTPQQYEIFTGMMQQ